MLCFWRGKAKMAWRSKMDRMRRGKSGSTRDSGGICSSQPAPPPTPRPACLQSGKRALAPQTQPGVR